MKKLEILLNQYVNYFKDSDTIILLHKQGSDYYINTLFPKYKDSNDKWILDIDDMLTLKNVQYLDDNAIYLNGYDNNLMYDDITEIISYINYCYELGLCNIKKDMNNFLTYGIDESR